MNFKDFVDLKNTNEANEAIETGINSSRSFEYEWNKLKKFKHNNDVIKLIKNNLSTYKYDLYSTMNTFYLVKDNKYFGHIEYKDVKNQSNNNRIIQILTSNSEIKSGFYVLMFTAILGLTNITEILSGLQLSTQAIKSYIKISKDLTKQHLTITVLSDNNYLEASTENIKKSTAVFSIKETNNNIHESFSEFEYKINNSDGYKRMYDQSNTDLNKDLFLIEI